MIAEVEQYMDITAQSLKTRRFKRRNQFKNGPVRPVISLRWPSNAFESQFEILNPNRRSSNFSDSHFKW